MNLSMRVTAIIILTCSLFFGCFTDHFLISPLEANHGKTTDHAEIVLRSGICIEATDIKVGIDITHYVLMGTDSLRQIRTNEIDRMIVKDHVGGAVGGFLAGCPIGYGAGILISELSGEFKNGSGNMMPVIYMASGAMLGSIGGAIYGAMRGYQENYIFPIDSSKRWPEQSVTK